MSSTSLWYLSLSCHLGDQGYLPGRDCSSAEPTCPVLAVPAQGSSHSPDLQLFSLPLGLLPAAQVRGIHVQPLAAQGDFCPP